MHRPPLMILSSNDNSRHLAEVGHELGAAGINILGIGGGEFEGVGVFAFTYVGDDDPNVVAQVEAAVQRTGGSIVEWDGLTVEVEDRPGRLGDMAEVLQGESINITALIVVGGHGASAIVLVGVPDGLASDAATALKNANPPFYVFESEA